MFYDLNMGALRGPKEPEKVLSLVNLARKHADSENYGEHNALLDLVCQRKDTQAERIIWHRSYHTRASNERHLWVSLREWLAENGHPYKEQNNVILDQPVQEEGKVGAQPLGTDSTPRQT